MSHVVRRCHDFAPESLRILEDATSNILCLLWFRYENHHQIGRRMKHRKSDQWPRHESELDHPSAVRRLTSLVRRGSRRESVVLHRHPRFQWPLPWPSALLLLHRQHLNAAQLGSFESSDPLTFWEKSWECSQLLTDFHPWPPSRTWKLGLNACVLCVTLCICGLKWVPCLQSHSYHAFYLNATRKQ